MEIDYATGLCFGLIIGAVAAQIVNVIWFILATRADEEWANFALKIIGEWSDFCEEIIDECYGEDDSDGN